MEEKEINKEQEETLTDKEAVVEDTDEKTDEPREEVTEGQTEEAGEEKDPLELANEQIADLKDKYLRQVAEFDNYRKRTLRERAELILNGGEKVITSLLPVLDDMERAIANGAKTEDPNVLREGMELIYHKLTKVLEGHGVNKIDTKDADFDGNSPRQGGCGIIIELRQWRRETTTRC